MRQNLFNGVFKNRIRKDQFEQYCEFYELDEDEAEKQLRSRGYIVFQT